MWLLFALLSGIFYSTSGLLTRHVLKQQKDAWAFSFFFSFFGALVSLPFMLTRFQIAATLKPWLILLIVGLLIVAQNFLYFRSSNFIEASVNGTIIKFRLVWVFFIGVILLNESFSWAKAAGTLLTVAAGMLLTAKRLRHRQSLIGIGLAFASTFFYATVIYFYKSLFTTFNSQSLTFFIFFFPVIINILVMPNAFSRILSLIKSDTLPVALACSLGGFANLSMNHALSIGEASRVLVIIESFLVVTLVGEHFWLKDRENFPQKLFAVLCAIAGAILIQLR